MYSLKYAGRSAVTIHTRLESLLKRDFVRHVSILAGGTAFAQVITMLVLPLVTRLYTPGNFSTLAVYTSVLSIVSIAACLRLDTAISIPESEEDAANLLAASLLFSLATTIAAAVVVLLLPDQLSELLKQPTLRPFLWMLPAGIWLSSSYGALQYWSLRKKRFSAIARTRLSQSVGGAGTQLAFGWAGVAPLGLLLGQAINSGAGLFKLGWTAMRADWPALKTVSIAGMRKVLGEYRQFPQYATFEALANMAGMQLPIVVIAALAQSPEAGYLTLANRAMTWPMSLIGRAVAQVYLSRAPDEFRRGNLGDFTARVMEGLSRAGIGPLIFIGLIAPAVFPLAFGERWRRAGELVSWMTPWFIAQLLSSPVSVVLDVTGRLRSALFLQLIGLVIRVGAVVLASKMAMSVIAETYAMAGFLFYSLYICIVINASGMSIRRFGQILFVAFPHIVLWTAGGVVGRWAIPYMGLARF